MLAKYLLRTAAVAVAWSLQMTGALPASAEPRVVAEGDGITVIENAVERADGGTGTLLIARIQPRSMTVGVVKGEDPQTGTDAPWSVTINGSYFSEAGRPVYHLRDGDRVIAPFRKGTNAVFWCRDERCAIQHSTDFAPGKRYDVAVQCAPRLLDDQGNPTKGVRGADVVDGRAGLAVAADGTILVFATAPMSWGGLSFRDVREYLTDNFQTQSILMLDGGNSARLRVQVGERTFSNGPFSRESPYSIRFTGR
jgi:hypothetical protein